MRPKKYQPTPESDKKREVNFTYHRPIADQPERYEVIRATAKAFAELLDECCPPSRELSLAMTKLEEVCLWANASIARNEKE